MKGLLIKDFQLIKVQKRFFVALVVMGVFMTFSMNDLSFAIGYITFVMPLFALSTISYDEFDNGNAFLFTLPISRKGYVIEKYLFGLLLGLGAMALSMVLALAFGLGKGMPAAWEALKGAPAVGLVMLVMLSVMTPLQLKFGAEKSRLAILIVGGSLFLAGVGGAKLLRSQGIDPNALVQRLDGLPAALMVAAALAAVAAVLAASVHISISIMKKKEF